MVVKKKSLWGQVFMRLRKNRLAMLGLGILILIVLTAIFANQIAPYPFDEQDLFATLEGPGAAHWFGTDEFGRDIFSRIVFGSRISLQVGFVAVGFSVLAGGFIGAIAGYYGGRTDNILMRCMDVLLSIPQLLLAISVAASLGPGLLNLMLAVGIAAIPQYARLVRASVLSIREQEFVEASLSVGASDFRIICRHILPNCMAPIIVQATLGVAFAILIAAGLSFIGLGLEPPTPEWGAMLSGGREFIRDYPYMTIFPGLAIMITILGLNFLGDGLRDALDPKLRN